MTLSIEDFSQQLLDPAMLAIAEAVDAYVAGKFVETYLWSGTAGTPPAALADIAAIDRQQNEKRVPLGGRVAVVNPKTKASLFGIPEFTEADKRGDAGTALREASMGRFMGYDWFMNQNVKSFTPGTLVANVTVTGANAVGTKAIAVDTDATGSLDLKKGDLIDIAGQGGITGESFVVSAPVTIASSNTGTVNVEPGLRVATAGGEAVSLAVSALHDANLAFHPNAVVLAAVPLALPQGAGRAEFVQNRGLGIRVVWDYDKDAKSDVVSLDILAGAKVQDPRLITRVLG
jgi:hypothetical protein